MPTPHKGEARSEFLSRCVPMLMHEGRKQPQAVAICYSLYRQGGGHGEVEDPDPADNPSGPTGPG